MYKIVLSPNPILRNTVNMTNIPKEKLGEIILEMKKTLIAQKDPEGVGLAANQVGLPYKIFLARFTTKKQEPVRVFINSEILEHSEELQNTPEDKKAPLEGCLSLPKFYGVVTRWKTLKLKFLDENLEEKTETFENFPAVVIQHEMDHLNGKIFVERILEQKGTLYKINGKDKKGKDTWEEVEL